MSQALLWPLNEIEHLRDLGSYLGELAGPNLIAPAADSTVQQTFEQLLERKWPIVYGTIEDWPSLLGALWRGIPRPYKPNFSGRVAISPPLGGESLSPPWIYAVPKERTIQWQAFGRAVNESANIEVGRVSRWLSGELDVTVDEIFAQCPQLAIPELRRFGRAADRLEKLREHGSADRAIDFLRTLVAIAPNASDATNLKEEALTILRTTLGNAKIGTVIALANFNEMQFPPQSLPFESLGNWLSDHAVSVSKADAVLLFMPLHPQKAEAWWQNSVTTTLTKKILESSPIWIDSMLQWLNTAEISGIISKVAFQDPNIEAKLLGRALLQDTKHTDSAVLKDLTLRLGWSALHAWTLLSQPALDALSEQLRFPAKPEVGVELLVRRMAGIEVVNASLALDEPNLFSILAERTKREPALLNMLDCGKPSWLRLWMAHIEIGGQIWPEGVDKARCASNLFDALLSGYRAPALIRAVGLTIIHEIQMYRDREKLWDIFDTGTTIQLLPFVAVDFLKHCEGGLQTRPEPRLAEAIIDIIPHDQPNRACMAKLLDWDFNISEDVLLNWMKHHNWIDISSSIAVFANRRRYSVIATEMYLSYPSNSGRLKGAIDTVAHLLSNWDQVRYAFGLGALLRDTILDNQAFVNRTAELGAELFPTSLEDVWVRAGGERKKMPLTAGSAEYVWRNAMAAVGAGAIKGGLQAIVKALLHSAPHNPDLQELYRMLSRR